MHETIITENNPTLYHVLTSKNKYFILQPYTMFLLTATTG